MKKILIIVNDVTTILQYRSELVSALVDDGNEVIVCVPESDRIPEIEALGATIFNVEVERHGKNPLKDIALYRKYVKLIREVQPDVVLTFTIKPNVYGSRAAGKLKVPCIVNITGLGAVVENKGIMQKITLFLHKVGLKKTECVFFQNQANRKFFEEKGIVKNNAEQLPGSGVNLEKFQYVEYPPENIEKINFVFVGRIMRVKGVFEIAEAAKMLKNRNDISFTIVGDVDGNTENPFLGMENVNCVGFHKDVRPFLKDAHAVLLASYHEGLANVLLEGAACGRAIVTTRVHGCQETFDEGITGFGCDAKNAESLCEALVHFADLPYEEKKKMGIAGRKKMEAQFDRKIVIEKYRKKIQELTSL